MIASFIFVNFLCGLLLAETEDATATKLQAAPDVCRSTRAVNLGIFGFYDKSFVENRKKINATENVTEYLSILVNATGQLHFGNIPCTNIKLVLVGAKFVENSSDVEDVDEFETLDIEKTLEKLQEYWSRNRFDLGDPDVGALFTAYDLQNNSHECATLRTESIKPGFTKDAEYEAYCGLISGAAYYKGACGNKSVAVVEENGGTFQGITGLGRAIATLLGVGFDGFSQEQRCRGDYKKYFTSTASQFVMSPDLSPCAKTELTTFIDCVSNLSFVCWNDTVDAVVISAYKTPYEFFEDNEFCSRHDSDHYQCPREKDVSNYKGCYRQCCREDFAGVEFVISAISTPYGRVCEDTGVCFADDCFKKNVSD